MNWLAHVFLSKPSIHFQLGNLLADFSKGNPWEGIHADTRQGLQTHQEIDSFTDTHAIFAQSKQRIGSSGRLRAVVIDLTYDHMLSKNWTTFSPVSLEEFLDGFYSRASEVLMDYPEEERAFIRAIISGDRLGQYKDADGIKRGMLRVDKRLSGRVLQRESTIEYFPNIQEAYSGLEQDFLRFFPELREHVMQSIHRIAK